MLPSQEEGGKDMVTLTILGSASAVPIATNDTTCLLLQSTTDALLIDCTGNPTGKLRQAGLDPYLLDGVLFTHRHPDHTYGFPSLVQSLGLMRSRREPRSRPLTIYGTADVLTHIHTLISAFELAEFFPLDLLRFSEIPWLPNQVVLDRTEFVLWTTPVEHYVPTVGLKVLNKETGKSITYSSDTNPCDALRSLAYHTTILIQECNFPAGQYGEGHTNSLQAGTLAREAEAQQLVLIHVPAYRYDVQLLPQEAQRDYEGPVEVALPFTRYSI